MWIEANKDLQNKVITSISHIWWEQNRIQRVYTMKTILKITFLMHYLMWNMLFSSWKKFMQKIKQDHHGQLHLKTVITNNNNSSSSSMIIMIIHNLRGFSSLWIAIPICKSGKFVGSFVGQIFNFDCIKSLNVNKS